MLSLLFVVGLARTTLPLYGISNSKRGSVLNFWLKILSTLASFQTLNNVDVGPALGFRIFLPEFETIRITVKRFAIISVFISNPLSFPDLEMVQFGLQVTFKCQISVLIFMLILDDRDLKYGLKW